MFFLLPSKKTVLAGLVFGGIALVATPAVATALLLTHQGPTTVSDQTAFAARATEPGRPGQQSGGTSKQGNGIKGTLGKVGVVIKQRATQAEGLAAKYARLVRDAPRLRGFHESSALDGSYVVGILRGHGVGRGGRPSGGQRPPAGAGREERFPVGTYAGGFAWPVEPGIVSSEFGERWGKLHAGIDIAADEGDPIRAAAPGVVIYAGSGLQGYGNVVIIRHDTETTTLYAHNKSLVVREGNSVAQGTLIARLGSTGHSTGPHLHFEIRQGEKPINPRSRLPGSKYIGK